jgi:hypothetical protein
MGDLGMAKAEFTKWEPMATAPRDGTLVLVAVRASEQGPAEHDAVRWAQSARSGEEGWVANDSDPFARFVYSEAELTGWSPLPTQMPALRSNRPTDARSDPGPDESDGAGI